jgi:hypothetical protein
MISEFIIFLSETLLKRWIARVVGLNVRFYCLNLLGQKVTRKMLIGQDKDLADQLSQDFYNAWVGMLFLLFVFLGIGYTNDWYNSVW